MTVAALVMTREHWHAMQEHIAHHAPLEACGLLAGKNDRVEQVIQINNQAQSPVRFRMDPLEQLNAFNRMDDEGLDLVGIFHSHPAGPETASATDIAEAAYQVVHVIWFPKEGGWNARGYWIQDGNSIEVLLRVAGE